MLTLRREEAALFLSDMHLSDEQPETAELVLGSLAQALPGVAHCFLLGDLFDAWVGDDVLDSPQAESVALRLVALLAGYAQQGGRVYLMHGNRDFLLGAGAPVRGLLARIPGAVLLPESVRIDLHGEPVLLCHGDALCTDDIEYQRFRVLARSSQWQRAFLAQPCAQRVAAARAMRAQSESSKQDKPMALMDANPQAIAAAMREAGVRVMIHGHTHRPAHHRFLLDGAAAQRWVLPDWDAARGCGGMLLARAGGMEAVGAWGMLLDRP